MRDMPKLTVCVPSRNRQRTFQETIRSLLRNMRMDVEFVLADNSDEPAIMNAFMEDVVGDPRVTYLPSTGTTLAMMDNWNRCLEAATGEFVCVIGDDDYIDVNVIDLIARTQKANAVVDVFVWSRLSFNWPDNRPHPCSVSVPLGTAVHKVARNVIHEEFFSWRTAAGSPNLAMGIYHGAVSKRILDRIRATYGGRYCEYPTVDFENVCKVLFTAEHFFHSDRCFSVLGACAQSNSAHINFVEKFESAHARFMAESGRNIDADPHMKDFPFPSSLGLAACIAQTQHWFLTTYGHKPVAGWEANFVESCGVNCARMGTKLSYDVSVKAYRDVISRWQGGRYLKFFQPPAFSPRSDDVFLGIDDKLLCVAEDIGGVETPAELYHLVEQMLARPEDVTINAILSRTAA